MENVLYKMAMKLIIGPRGLIQVIVFVDLVSINVKNGMV
jgi:hypothetical protein